MWKFLGADNQQGRLRYSNPLNDYTPNNLNLVDDIVWSFRRLKGQFVVNLKSILYKVIKWPYKLSKFINTNAMSAHRILGRKYVPRVGLFAH